MYITRVKIDHITAAQRHLRGYSWHRQLWNAFPGDRHNRPFLYRIDSTPAGHRVLMLSGYEPQKQPWGIWETTKVPTEFWQYQAYRFQLRANPVRRIGNKARPIGVHELHDWINQKLHQVGAEPLQVLCGRPLVQRIRKPEGKLLTLNTVDFTGLLEVKDQKVFIDAAKTGIGRARAWGMGLLMLAPTHP